MTKNHFNYLFLALFASGLVALSAGDASAQLCNLGYGQAGYGVPMTTAGYAPATVPFTAYRGAAFVARPAGVAYYGSRRSFLANILDPFELFYPARRVAVVSRPVTVGYTPQLVNYPGTQVVNYPSVQQSHYPCVQQCQYPSVQQCQSPCVQQCQSPCTTCETPYMPCQDACQPWPSVPLATSSSFSSGLRGVVTMQPTQNPTTLSRQLPVTSDQSRQVMPTTVNASGLPQAGAMPMLNLGKQTSYFKAASSAKTRASSFDSSGWKSVNP